MQFHQDHHGLSLLFGRLEEKWSAVKVPLTVPTFEELVCYDVTPVFHHCFRDPPQRVLSSLSPTRLMRMIGGVILTKR